MNKRFFLLLVLCCSITLVFSQAKKPTIMVVPSDNWCFQKGYVQTFDNQGTETIVSDYARALQQDLDLKVMIATINDLMAERGFPCKDLEQQVKIIAQQNAELNLITSKNGNETAESPLDRLNRVAKSDIILEISWVINTLGPKRSLTYIIEGKDAYTGKSIGSVTGTSEPTFSSENATLLREAVLANIDNFNYRLQSHFEDLFANGREIVFQIRVFEDNAAGIDLESEYGDEELAEIIDIWMYNNTVEHRFSKLGMSENYVSYEQVRIPLYNESGMPMDAEGFARQLRKVLRKDPYNIPVKVMPMGLGRCILYLGEK